MAKKRAKKGRPATNRVELRFTVTKRTAAILTHLATARGLYKRQRGSPFFGPVVDDMAAKTDEPLPQYLRLAI